MKIPVVFSSVLNILRKYHKVLILTLTPLLLLPLPLAIHSQAALAGYGIAIMATFWILEVTPIAVTSLLPLVIFPLFGVLPAKDVCLQYMTDTNVLLLGGLLIAVAIEEWNVHRRIALGVLLLVGAQPRRLMLGFMLVTAFISMWITNTATTAMMTPIMEAVLKQLDEQYMKDVVDELEKDDDEDSYDKTVSPAYDLVDGLNGGARKAEVSSGEGHEMRIMNSDDVDDVGLERSTTTQELVVGDSNDELKEPESKQLRRHKELCKAMLLSICYAANIGGTATLTGSAPQLVFKGQFKAKFPSGPSISFFYWFVFAFPMMVLFLFLGWLYLQFQFMGISWKHLCFCFRLKKRNKEKGKGTYAIMQKQYRDLGPISFAQGTVIAMFVLLVLLWFFREPQFIPGWGDLFKDSYISDGTAAMIIGFLLFQLPSQMPDIPFVYKNKDRVKLKSATILAWKPTQQKLAWDVLLLLGAGFALAQACEKSGLSVWLSCQMVGLASVSPWVIALVVSVMLTFLTEITSNTATATILLPILASLAQSVHVNPLFLMVPCTICASFAFMLPVATPPNAIVFGTGRLTVPDMAKAGFAMNIIGILVITLAINTWGYAYYGLGEFPQWAAAGNTTSSC